MFPFSNIKHIDNIFKITPTLRRVSINQHRGKSIFLDAILNKTAIALFTAKPKRTKHVIQPSLWLVVNIGSTAPFS